MIAPAQSLPREVNAGTLASTRRSVIRSAHAIGPLGWAAVAVTTSAALISMTQHAVPVASAIAVALLVPAAMVDIVEQRLPNQIIVTSALALAVGLVFSSSDVLASNVVLGVVLLASPLMLMHLLSPSSMGFGDVKMALVLGAAVGAVHWQLALVTIALAAGASATVALLRQMREIAFGPGLVAAAAFGLLAHPWMLTPAALDATIRFGHFG